MMIKVAQNMAIYEHVYRCVSIGTQQQHQYTLDVISHAITLKIRGNSECLTYFMLKVDQCYSFNYYSAFVRQIRNVQLHIAFFSLYGKQTRLDRFSFHPVESTYNRVRGETTNYSLQNVPHQCNLHFFILILFNI